MSGTELLRSKILESGLKISFLAEQLGLSPYGFSRKVDGKSEFKVSEMQRVIDMLHLSQSEINDIFFKK